MEFTSTHEAIRLVEPILLSYVEPSELLEESDRPVITEQTWEQGLSNEVYEMSNISRTQSPSRQSTSVDGASTPTRECPSCSGLKRGPRECHNDVYDTLKKLDLFDQEPPKGKRRTWLLKAIDEGSVKAVELLINLGANVNQRSPKADSEDPVYLPLCFTAGKGETAIVELLLQNGADIHARDHWGDNALLTAAYYGRNNVINLLLKAPYNADIEVQTTSTDNLRGFTPLMMAVSKGHLSTVKLLFDKGANRDMISEAGDPLLHIATGKKRLDITEFLVANGAQVVATNKMTEDTACHVAIRKNSRKVAEFLIDKDCLLLNAENKKKQTPLALAVELKKPEMVEMLLNRGAQSDPVDNHGRTPLHNAILADDSESVKLLVERGTKVEFPDNDGQTPLHHAVMRENPTIVAMLLSHGYKMDIKNSSGIYPLQYIMDMPRLQQSQAVLLLQEFLQVHVQGNEFHAGYHALPKAVHDGKLHLVKEILTRDPQLATWKPSATSGYQPPLHEAVNTGRKKIVKELCSSESLLSSMNMTDHEGKSALYQAIISNQPAMISLLIEKGADREFQSGPKDSYFPPLHLAVREQNPRAVEILLQKGADPRRRVAEVSLCRRCSASKGRRSSGGDARCVLHTMDLSLRGPDFQTIYSRLLRRERILNTDGMYGRMYACLD